MRKRIGSGCAVLLAVLFCLLLTACSGKAGGPFAGREAVDLSGYNGMKEYSGKVLMADTTVKEISELMKEKKSFVVYAGFANCPYCNRLIPELCEVIQEEKLWIGYLDTRKNPAWNSNIDIDDYDLFVELFGEYLSLDSSQIKHLYVPVVIFIKDGETVEFRQGVVTGADNPSDPLTEEQRAQLKKELKECLDKIK